MVNVTVSGVGHEKIANAIVYGLFISNELKQPIPPILVSTGHSSFLIETKEDIDGS